MAIGARVDSIDAIKDFRVYLAKFQESAGLSLGDADSDVSRMERWLDGEAHTHWTGQIRKRQEALVKAEEALRYKRLYKDASGSTPSAVEELKAVQVAKKNLEEAQQKLAAVKQWQKRLQKEINLYRGGVGRFQVTVSSGVPAAIAELSGTIEQLEKYTGITPETTDAQTPEMAGTGVGTDGDGPSMARAADEAAAQEAADPAVIRGRAPLPDAAETAPPLPAGSVWLACGTVTHEQWKTAAPEPPADQDVVLVTAPAMPAERIYMLRTAGGWCLGSVDVDAAPVYNKTTVAELRAARPDLSELLKLPVDTLVIVGAAGLVAVYDSSNRIMEPPPADGEST
jgi:hypothetical protein